MAALESLSSLILSSKYPVNFVVPNSSSSTRIEDPVNGPFLPETDLEAVTLKIVELGVELRRGRMIREVLIHLRGALQSVHALSFEFVLRALLRAAEAQIISAQIGKDLEAMDLDDDSGNVDGTSVTPWLRFYWEILRMVLDLARNNSRLELVYHDSALSAFQFCRRFGRKSEFRRLSEMIRYHLALSVKYPGQQNAVPLATSTESHQLALELRFNQLTLACDMELWQEAFRTVEDIYGLQLLARKSVRQLTAPEYFDKLARIFAKSDNFLFLAATLLRQPRLDVGQEETLLMASLAVPIESACDPMQAERLAQIIGLSSVPTRASLFRIIQQRGLVSRAQGPVKDLLAALESGNVLSGIEALRALQDSGSVKPFIRGCYENLLSILIGQIIKTRDSISIKELTDRAGVEAVRSSGLIPKFNMEMFLLRSGVKGIKICHVSGEIKIDRSVFLAQAVGFDNVESSMTWSHLHGEMRKMLNGTVAPPATPGNLKNLLKAEHEANLERRHRIEKRKEQLEAAAAEKDRQEARERALKTQMEVETERLRQAEEIARRDRERVEKDRAEIRRLEAEKRLAEQEKMKEAAGARLNREKIAAQANRLDYLERALRADEIPLLEADYAKQKEADVAAYEARCSSMLEAARAKFARDLEMKRRFVQCDSFESDYASFFSQIRSRRETEFQVRQEQAQTDLAAEKEKRRARIAAEMEARRKIDAERAAAACAPAPMEAASSAAGSGKYVPPVRGGSAAGAWRRDPVPEAASPAAPAVSAPVPVAETAAATPPEAEPKKEKFIPRFKLQK